MPAAFAFPFPHLLALALFLAIALGQELSPCLKTCLMPVAGLQRTNADIFVHYEKICDQLEPAAKCAQKCSMEDHRTYLQVTFVLQLVCLEFEEALEDHRPCLRQHAESVETECKGQCKPNSSGDDDDDDDVEETDRKRQSQATSCVQNECALLCQVKGLSAKCRGSEGVLKEIHLRKVRHLEAARSHQHFGAMPLECQQIHDSVRAKRLLEDL